MVETPTESNPGLSGLCVAVLAGGLGSRLAGVAGDCPKVLADISGRPFLFYLLDQLASAGVRRTVLCTGYRAEQVRAACGDRYGSLSLRYSRELEPRGTGGALRLALPLLDSDPVLALNGDSFCAVDLTAVLAGHYASRAGATLVLVWSEDCSRYGRVEFDDAAHVTRFVEKGIEAGPGWINAGVYCLSRSCIASIPPDRAVSLEHEILPSLVGQGLYGSSLGGRFLDIGTPSSYSEAAAFFAEAGVEPR
jgi:D-glycero-alpha-D-manno-heptose 1-phosphate guanylyltransferase